jgi:hypothetical protein
MEVAQPVVVLVDLEDRGKLRVARLVMLDSGFHAVLLRSSNCGLRW